MSTIATGQGKELKFAVINASGAGDNTIVAADTNRKIKVVSYVVVASAAVAITFKSGASTSLTGSMSLATNGGASSPGQVSSHLFETTANAALVLNLGGAVPVGGHIAYFLEA